MDSLRPVKLDQEELRAYMKTLEGLNIVQLCWEMDKHKIGYELEFAPIKPCAVIVKWKLSDGMRLERRGYRVTIENTLEEALKKHLMLLWLDTYTERHQ